MSIHGKTYIKSHDGYVGTYYEAQKPYYRGIERAHKRITDEFEKFKFCLDSIGSKMVTGDEQNLFQQLKRNQLQMSTYLNEFKRMLETLMSLDKK